MMTREEPLLKQLVRSRALQPRDQSLSPVRHQSLSPVHKHHQPRSASQPAPVHRAPLPINANNHNNGVYALKVLPYTVLVSNGLHQIANPGVSLSQPDLTMVNQTPVFYSPPTTPRASSPLPMSVSQCGSPISARVSPLSQCGSFADLRSSGVQIVPLSSNPIGFMSMPVIHDEPITMRIDNQRPDYNFQAISQAAPQVQYPNVPLCKPVPQNQPDIVNSIYVSPKDTYNEIPSPTAELNSLLSCPNCQDLLNEFQDNLDENNNNR